MFKALKLGLMAFCVATVLAQVILVSVFWIKGGLTAEKRFRMLAVLYDVDVDSPSQSANSNRPAADDAPSPESAFRESSDLASRRGQFSDKLKQLVAIEGNTKEDHRRNSLRRIDFDNLLAKLEQETIASGLLEVRQTLEAIKTKQAKAQILRMLDDNAQDDVIKMVKAMPMDKRKKIFSEFKSPRESERLHDILRQLREVATNDGKNAPGQKS